MDEPSKIRPFPNEASRKTVRELLEQVEKREPSGPQPNPNRKLGLYPLGDDVIISTPLYYLIVTVLEHGSAADQAKVAEMMRTAYAAPFPL